MVLLINILLNGSNGNMGNVISEYVRKSDDFNLLYKIDKDNANLVYSIAQKPDVIIDFSVPSATFSILDYAVKNLVPIVIATTGFTEMQEKRIAEFSEAIPIFKSANMCLGVNVVSNLSSSLAQILTDFDIEIVEKHHKKKIDSPSGTALMIANKINKYCGNKYKYIFSRSLAKQRKSSSEIGFSSIRGGGLVGEHSILFLGENETIELKHTAYSRNIYVEGALDAARFIITKKNGLFSMEDLV